MSAVLSDGRSKGVLMTPLDGINASQANLGPPPRRFSLSENAFLEQLHFHDP